MLSFPVFCVFPNWLFFIVCLGVLFVVDLLLPNTRKTTTYVWVACFCCCAFVFVFCFALVCDVLLLRVCCVVVVIVCSGCVCLSWLFVCFCLFCLTYVYIYTSIIYLQSGLGCYKRQQAWAALSARSNMQYRLGLL